MRIVALSLLFATLLVPVSSRAVVTAEYLPGSPSASYGLQSFDPDRRVSQTFLTTVAGFLDEVTVSLISNGPTGPSEISMWIAETTDPNPGDTLRKPSALLGMATITTPVLIGTPSFFSFDFSSLNINLAIGTQYAIIMTPATSGGYSWINDDSNGYTDGAQIESLDGGSTWLTDESEGPNPFDLVFSVSIQAIPEPSSLASCLLGLMVFVSRRRRV